MKSVKATVRVAAIVSLALILCTQAAVADWSLTFNLTNHQGFDRLQFNIVEGSFAATGITDMNPTPADAAHPWVQLYNDNNLLLAEHGAGWPASLETLEMSYKLHFAGAMNQPVKFYMQAWDGYELRTEITYCWDGSALIDDGGSPWADVRVDQECVNPFVSRGRLDLVPDAACYDVGDTVTVEIELSGITDPNYTITGGQFFLSFDPARLQFEGAEVGGAPWVMEISESHNQPLGTIDYAVGVDPLVSPDGAMGGTMAVLTFTAINEVCQKERLVTFRQTCTPPTVLTASCCGPVVPVLYEMPITTIDSTKPWLIRCPEGSYDPDDPMYVDVNDPGYIDPLDPANGMIEEVECDEFPDPAIVFGDDACSTISDVTDPAHDPDYHVTVTYEQDPVDVIIPDSDCVEQLVMRTWTATDECGNYIRCRKLYQIVDTTSPTLQGCPSNVIIECDEVDDLPGVDAVTATDNCDTDPEITLNVTKVIAMPGDDLYDPDCPQIGYGQDATCNYYLYRVYWAEDACGNRSCCTQIVRVVDTVAPELVYDPAEVPEHVVIECDEVDTLPGENAVSATDTCSDVTKTFSSIDSDHECLNTYTITRTWTFTDECCNETSYTQLVSVQDTTPPVLHGAPDPTNFDPNDPFGIEIWVDCANVPPVPDVTATDNCIYDPCNPDIHPYVQFIEIREGTETECDYTLTRRWTSEDACGNRTSVEQLIHVNDLIPPVITCPQDLTWKADVGTCGKLGCPEWATAVDGNGCTDPNDVVVVGYRDDGHPLCNYPYPACDPATGICDPAGYTTTITWLASDECGNHQTCESTITILPYNELLVRIGIPVRESVSRCIVFELYNCEDPNGPVVEVEYTFDFEMIDAMHPELGAVAEAIIDIPCGEYTCIRARDPFHSIRKTVYSLEMSTVENMYKADFFGVDFAPLAEAFGSPVALLAELLVYGNLDDNCVVDIRDYGYWICVFGCNFGDGDTVCGWSDLDCMYHGDFSGDGDVDTGDFTYIQAFFLALCDDNCCELPQPCGAYGEEAITEIAVDDLASMGLSELAPADLNADGVINTSDIQAFLDGVRPGDLNQADSGDLDGGSETSAPQRSGATNSNIRRR